MYGITIMMWSYSSSSYYHMMVGVMVIINILIFCSTIHLHLHCYLTIAAAKLHLRWTTASRRTVDTSSFGTPSLLTLVLRVILIRHDIYDDQDIYNALPMMIMILQWWLWGRWSGGRSSPLTTGKITSTKKREKNITFSYFLLHKFQGLSDSSSLALTPVHP